MEPSRSLPHVYQFRVVVQGINPLIWRCILIRSNMSLATLPTTLQLVFAWSDYICITFVFMERVWQHAAGWSQL
jgi:Plasmid pRiA4b ORF-3-like protein